VRAKILASSLPDKVTSHIVRGPGLAGPAIMLAFQYCPIACQSNGQSVALGSGPCADRSGTTRACCAVLYLPADATDIAADNGCSLPHRFGDGQTKSLANGFLQHHRETIHGSVDERLIVLTVDDPTLMNALQRRARG
jgi:hypothetical protein